MRQSGQGETRSHPLTLRNTLRELLALPKVIGNPLRPALRSASFGAGRPVLVIPGLLTGDISTSFLRRSLSLAGFCAYGWEQGINTGANPAKLAALEARVSELRREHGKKATVIGWSLGGLYARVLAQRMEADVAMVMTIASPFSGDPHANRAWRLYELLNDHSVDNPPFAEDLAQKPAVPTIAIWSAVDGVVSPECTLGKESESDFRIRVDAQHFALGSSGWCVGRILEILAEFSPPNDPVKDNPQLKLSPGAC
ncbi:MAG: alpha/beta hydrolase [Porphyrobacter sp.]|nr:alpha/beta hydrolase [Porphyrobacter sp.]